MRYVRLQNRNDCCAERLTDVDIYLGSTAETYTGNALVKSDVSVLSNVMLEVEINALGRYIYLNRPSAAGLTVCKFYVFAGNRNGPPPSASPSPPPPSTPGASCKAGLCTGNIFETCFYDPGCAAGGLGCNAGGKTLCRFCEFGAYKAIECAPCSGASCRCLTESCTQSVLSSLAGPHSCGERVVWLERALDLSEAAACHRVAEEFPEVCGACDPR